MRKLSRILIWMMAAILILEGIAFLFSAFAFYGLCHHASNWNTLTFSEKNTCLGNSVPSLEYALAALGLIWLVLKIQPLILLPLWIGLTFYGMHGLLAVAPTVVDWKGALAGDLVAIGAIEYSGFAVVGLMGILRIFEQNSDHCWKFH